MKNQKKSDHTNERVARSDSIHTWITMIGTYINMTVIISIREKTNHNTFSTTIQRHRHQVNLLHSMMMPSI